MAVYCDTGVNVKNFLFQPIAVIFALIDFQAKNPELYENKDDDDQYDDNDNAKVDANTITRWSVRDNGMTIVATTADAFPVSDKTTERLEVINVGQNLTGDTVFLATVQDSGKNLDIENSEYEAKCFNAVLPEPGSHFGTSAHADDSFTTIGLIYVLDKDGKLKEWLLIRDMTKAFVAGSFDGKVTVAIETTDRFAIVDAMTFVDRVRNGATLVLDTEGKEKADGERLTRAELDDDKSVMAVQNGNIKYYDQDGNKLDREDEVKDNVVTFPGVDQRGQQVATKRVVVTKTGGDRGTIERAAANS